MARGAANGVARRIGCGRLLPLGEDVWLRSPGMVLVDGGTADEPAALATIVHRMHESGIERAIAVEGVLATVLRRGPVPRTLAPAATRATASELLFELSETMRGAGLSIEVPVEEVPEDLRARAGENPEHRVLEASLDHTLSEWMAALAAQAGPGEKRGGGARPSRKQVGSGRKKSKHRRNKRRR